MYNDDHVSAMLGLARLFADPKGIGQQLVDLQAATQKSHEAAAEARDLEAAKAAHDSRLGAERAEHDSRLDHERKAHDAKMKQELDALRRDKNATAAALQKAEATAAENERLKTELCSKIAKIQQAAA